MSLELHVVLEQGNLPDRTRWQEAIDALSVPLVLDPELRVREDSGFVPCKLGARDSGFELYVEDAAPLAAAYPTLADAAGPRDFAVSFRWGGDLAECACSMAAAAALVSEFGGIAYYPDDDMLYTLDGLKKDINECFAEC